jgi:predicted acetyltransferase
MNNQLVPILCPATLAGYPIIQNLAQFYIYDVSRECGFSISENGLYEPNDYKSYVLEPLKKAFFIKVMNEIAGFVLLSQKTLESGNASHKIDQFFILAKFQHKGIGREVVFQILEKYSGQFEAYVLPQNKKALLFWHKVIGKYTNEKYISETKTISYDEHEPQRVVFTFDTREKQDE